MNQKSNFTALWFIPLVALLLAGMFTIIGVIGWKLVKSSSPKKETVVAQQPVKKAASRTTTKKARPVQNVPVPAAKPANPPQLPKTGLSFSPARARFEMALAQCLGSTAYPCTWQDTQDGVLKQFTLTKPDGIVGRNIRRMDNSSVSQTAISLQGRVLLYRENNTTWYFDNDGLVRHIAVGAVPKAGPDDPHDSYFYNIEGQLNACVCADKSNTCCARAPQLQGTPRTYCALFAPDAELCPLP